MDSVKKIEMLREMVSHFQANIKQYKSTEYDEANVRVDFIDKFFELLDWDVRNTSNASERYRDVVREDRIAISGQQKAPDYSFRVGGQRKFFVEAKKPGVSISVDPTSAYQIRRYGYSARLAVSILTDFEEFAVYDTRVKPNEKDIPSVARIFFCRFDEYEKHFAFLYETFSKTAVLQGRFDTFAEANEDKKGTTQVDAAFLEMLSDWREHLAKGIALRNKDIDVFQLNHAVQVVIDRIIFLRFAEAHDLEDHAALLKTLEHPDVYWELKGLFALADQKYNSGLFALDDFINGLNVDNQVFKEIISGLYYPRCPYEFSVLPIEVMGSAYEQFLGRTIRLTPGHHAKVEEKPEVRKAGGVYYTPQFVVDYIVQNTVGEKVKGKTPKEVNSLSVLDPACGSGSFLIGAYTFLLDWHLDYYSTSQNAKQALKQERIYQIHANEYHLTIEEKQRILLNNIYGVDIDQQAVEVTRLSLLIKLMEGENRESAGELFKHSDFRLLPNLDKNVKCGNSLIGGGFFGGQQGTLFRIDELRRINAFDWNREFPEIVRKGGFDCIIGNPPYVRIQTMKESTPVEVEAYKTIYKSAQSGNYDLYVIFAEKGLSLLSERGLLGFILPHKFFNALYGEEIRKIIAAGKHLKHVVHFGDQQVFGNATTYTCIMILDKAGCDKCHFVKVSSLSSWLRDKTATEGEISANRISQSKWNFVVGRSSALFDKLSSSPIKLGDISYRIAQGIRTSANEVYVLDLKSVDGNDIVAYSKILDREVKLEKSAVRSFLQGRNIRSFLIEPSDKVAIIPYRVEKKRAILLTEKELESQYPKALAYLSSNKAFLSERERGRMRGPMWYGYIYPKNIEIMYSPKILVPDIANKASFALDRNGEYAFTSGYGLIIKESVALSPLFLLGLLNSRVLDYYLKRVSTTMRGGFFRYFTQYLEELPICVVDIRKSDGKEAHDSLVILVEEMIDLQNNLLAKAKTDHDRKLIEDRIKANEKGINRIVYDLYNLNEEEIKIVEAE